MTDLKIKGSKAQTLAALYNASKPQGFGRLSFNPTPMTDLQAEILLKMDTYFDYVQGRIMKVDLSGDTFSPVLYDRDNGQGAAERALESIV